MITPYLLYEDVAGAVKFLSKVLGFKKSGIRSQIRMALSSASVARPNSLHNSPACDPGRSQDPLGRSCRRWHYKEQSAWKYFVNPVD